MLDDLTPHGEDLADLAVIQDKQKRASGRSRRAVANATLERSFFRSSFGSRCRSGSSGFGAAKPTHGVRTDAPEDD
jgi:hypothetical protein